VSTMQTEAPDPPVVPRKDTLPEGSVCPRVPEHRSRHPVETPTLGSGVHMGSLWPSRSGSICVSEHNAFSTLVFPHSNPPGRYGTDVAEAASVCIFPNCSAPLSSGESPPDWNKPTASCTSLAEPDLVHGLYISP